MSPHPSATKSQAMPGMNTKKRICVLTFLLAAGLGAGLAGAQQYKWTDRNGRVQYGDSPPPGVQATPLRVPSGAAAPTPAPAAKKDDGKPAAKAGPPTPAEQEAEFRRRQIEAQKEQEKLAQASREAAVRKDNCERAQEYLRTLESGQRITRTNAQGEREFLDDAQIGREKAQARDKVRAWCS